jgi:hypothetical protein
MDFILLESISLQVEFPFHIVERDDFDGYMALRLLLRVGGTQTWYDKISYFIKRKRQGKRFTSQLVLRVSVPGCKNSVALFSGNRFNFRPKGPARLIRRRIKPAKGLQ